MSTTLKSSFEEVAVKAAEVERKIGRKALRHLAETFNLEAIIDIDEDRFGDFIMACNEALSQDDDGKSGMTLEEAVADDVDPNQAPPADRVTRDYAVQVIAHEMTMRSVARLRLLEIENAVHLGMGIVMNAMGVEQLAVTPEALIKFTREKRVTAADIPDGNTLIVIGGVL